MKPHWKVDHETDLSLGEIVSDVLKGGVPIGLAVTATVVFERPLNCFNL